ncbi:MAG: RNA polymerase sigma factor, partial [bacterium]
SSFSTWLYRIAINVWKNQMKRTAHKVSMEMDQMPLIESETTLTPEKILAGKQAFTDISEALNLLDEKYRAPFLLRQIDGFSYREIGYVMEIDENAARVRVYRARHALRDMIGGE